MIRNAKGPRGRGIAIPGPAEVADRSPRPRRSCSELGLLPFPYRHRTDRIYSITRAPAELARGGMAAPGRVTLGSLPVACSPPPSPHHRQPAEGQQDSLTDGLRSAPDSAAGFLAVAGVVPLRRQAAFLGQFFSRAGPMERICSRIIMRVSSGLRMPSLSAS